LVRNDFEKAANVGVHFSARRTHCGPKDATGTQNEVELRVGLKRSRTKRRVGSPSARKMLATGRLLMTRPGPRLGMGDLLPARLPQGVNLEQSLRSTPKYGVVFLEQP
jgi:hypothetical protein